MVMTSNSWLAPAIPAMRELSDFERRYWKAIAPEVAGMSAEQMAAVMAMYPMVKQAMERLQAEGTKLQGTPLATTTVFEAVKSKEQAAQDSQQSSGGGLGGMLARKMMKNESRPRATVFTLTHETLEVSSTRRRGGSAAPCRLQGEEVARSGAMRGRKIVNVVPLFSSLSTKMPPPLCFTMP